MNRPSAPEFVIAESQIVTIPKNGITFLWSTAVTKGLGAIANFRAFRRTGTVTTCISAGNMGYRISMAFTD